jgi:RNA repair, ligase-Pnkp-associating, region of Hen1
MLLTLTTTHEPATDLGYLLHKNPSRIQTEELSFGRAHVFYPEAESSRCTAAVLLEIGPVALVRGRRGPAGEGGQLEQGVCLACTVKHRSGDSMLTPGKGLPVRKQCFRTSCALERDYCMGSKVNFCTRQFNNSAAKRTFSDGHAIS